MVDAEAVKRAVQLLTGSFRRPRPGLGGEKVTTRLALEPGSDAQLRIAVARRGVDVIDTMLCEDLERSVGDRLCNSRQGCCPKDGATALMPGPPELGVGDHRTASPV